MDPGLYIAAAGMVAGQVRQDQLTNDLANASTPGYKADDCTQQSFGELLLSNTATGQLIGGLQTGVRISKITTDLTPQPLQQTGQPLDFGIVGQGFFAVRTAGGVRYTRDGQFSSSAQGLLVDGNGDPVLSQTGATIRVAANGTVPAAAVGVFNVNGAVKQGYNLYGGTPAGGATGVVRQGELEQSAVDPVQTMTDMIASLQAYQSGENAIQTIDQTLQTSANSVASLGGGS
jgi:flagellar basal-body rod protein FlgF